MTGQTAAQAARTAANEAQDAANYVAEEADKVEILKADLPAEDPIPSYYGWVDDDEIAKTQADANAAAAEAANITVAALRFPPC
jgi:hypothetical protein